MKDHEFCPLVFFLNCWSLCLTLDWQVFLLFNFIVNHFHSVSFTEFFLESWNMHLDQYLFRAILDQNFIPFEERDLFLDESFRYELQNRVKEGEGIKVPCVFFKGFYIGVSILALSQYFLVITLCNTLSVHSSNSLCRGWKKLRHWMNQGSWEESSQRIFLHHQNKKINQKNME